jgi:hypothetical protein
MLYELFYTDKVQYFKIRDFVLNTPINIVTLNKRYLSCYVDEKCHSVDFYDIDDGTNKQKWVIEIDEYGNYYIKTLYESYSNVKYLGCPNSNNRVFLYTSKNNYTKWNISHYKRDIYKVVYVGEKFDKKDVSLVVARYNENISWVLPYNDIAIVYNKGCDDDELLNFDNVVQLENIGREGHTYLEHITRNYNTLTNRTIFVQGGPFEHNPTILFGIDNYYTSNLDVQPLGLIYDEKSEIPPNNLLSKYKTTTDYGLEYYVMILNSDVNYCDDYYFYDFGISMLVKNYRERFCCNSLVGNFIERSNFPRTKQINKIRFCFCALFSVVKKNIHKYDTIVYENLKNELTSFNSQGGENGYILERLWLYIFED